jgi:hypothetical protein
MWMDLLFPTRIVPFIYRALVRVAFFWNWGVLSESSFSNEDGFVFAETQDVRFCQVKRVVEKDRLIPPEGVGRSFWPPLRMPPVETVARGEVSACDELPKV